MVENQRDPLPILHDYASGRVTARGVLISALADQGAMARLCQLDTRGLLTDWIPELAVLKGVEQPKEHYWDVFEHSLHTVGALEVVVEDILALWQEVNLRDYLSQIVDGECSRLVLLKLGALLHDIAKPQTKAIQPNGRMRFFGHPELGAQMARSIMARLGFSEKAQEMVGLMVEYHMRPDQLTNRSEPPSERALSRFFRDSDSVGIEILLLSMADHMAARGPMLTEDEWRQHVDRTREVITNHLNKREAEKPTKLLDGHTVMARFGLQPGPLIGELLRAVEEARAKGEIHSTKEAVTLVKRILSKH